MLPFKGSTLIFPFAGSMSETLGRPGLYDMEWTNLRFDNFTKWGEGHVLSDADMDDEAMLLH